MNNILTSFIIVLFFTACQSQEKKTKKTFVCNKKEMTVELPSIIEEKPHTFAEGKVILLKTKDSVFIEFYCGGNYSPLVNNKSKFKILSESSTSKRGIDTSGKYWRKDGKLSYFNCQAKDTVKYNKIFDQKIIYEAK